MGRFGNYEYEVEDISKGGDDLKTWEYKIKNLKSGFKFKYTIRITKTALNCDPVSLMSPIWKIVETKGESLVQDWLKEGKEIGLGALIGEKSIKLI